MAHLSARKQNFMWGESNEMCMLGNIFSAEDD